MKKRKIYGGKNLSLAFGFCLIVFAIIVLYFSWKVLKVMNQSRFDSGHEFVLSVKEVNNTQDVIAFLPDTQTVNIVTFHNISSDIDMSKVTQLPIDAQISADHIDSISPLLIKEIFSWGKDGLSLIDAVKLYLFIHGLPQTAYTTQAFSYPISQEVLDTTIPKLFTDKSLYQDAQTIGIINASGVPGIGNRFAKFLTNIGANVIIVNTADSLQDTTTLAYGGNYSYSVAKMQKVLHVKAVNSQKKMNLVDITITIGKDKAGNFSN